MSFIHSVKDASLGLEATLRRVVRDAAAEAIKPLVRGELRELVREEIRTALGSTRALPGSKGSQLLSPSEAAKLLGVKTRTVRTWIANGTIPSQRVGRLLRIRRDDLDSFIEAQNDAPPLGSESVDEQAARILGRYENE